uniref:MADS-box domain-containing protein n=1 Tax=Oryza punctata TaxID=4537 RepID=A0A0E0ME25_ORYPU
MARLSNNAARRVTLRRRRAGLIKKVTELSILCSVQASIVVYNIDEAGDPVAWPSVEEAKNMWSKLMDMPEATQKKWMQDSKTLLQQQIAKLQKKLGNLKAENYRREITNIISELTGGRRKNLDDLSPEMVKDVKLEVAKHREVIRNRIVELRVQGASSSVVVAPQEEIVAPHAFQFDLNEPALVDDDVPIVREEADLPCN